VSDTALSSAAVVANTIIRTVELGATITDAAVDEKVTTIFCTPVTRGPRCPDCSVRAATATLFSPRGVRTCYGITGSGPATPTTYR